MRWPREDNLHADDADRDRDARRIALTALTGGPHTVTTYVGPLAQLENVCGAIMQRVPTRKERVIGLTAIERHVTTQLLAGALQQIEISFPVDTWALRPATFLRAGERIERIRRGGVASILAQEFDASSIAARVLRRSRHQRSTMRPLAKR
jgi:hypothetical protein